MLAGAKLSAPVLSALIPRISFERILRDSGRTASSQLTALYLDQPLNRQLALIWAGLGWCTGVLKLWGGSRQLENGTRPGRLAAAEHRTW